MRSPFAGLVVAIVAITACSAPAAHSERSGHPTVRNLPRGAVVDYQLGGAYPPADDITAVVRDRTAAPDPDRYSICYVNAFQTQPDTLAWWKKHHPKLLLRDDAGRAVHDPGWPDEVLLDLRTRTLRGELATILASWFERCADDGYAAVEPDNLDSFGRSSGLLTVSQAEDMAQRMTAAAHRHGLAIAQKNTTEIDGRHLGFDFAIAEECEVHRECGTHLARYPGRVIEVEYTDNGRRAFSRACTSRGGEHPIELRDRDLLPKGARGHVDRHC